MNLKKYISDSLFPFLGKLLLFNNRYINVIYYHDIVTGENEGCMRMNIDKFFKQMDYLYQNGYETLRFDDLSRPENLSFKKKRVLITFDDGWVSNYVQIFEFMKNRNLKYNVFLAAGLIDNNPDYLTWDMIRTMHNSGLVGFGSHTYNHVDAHDFTTIDFETEIKKADSLIESEIGYKPVDFCYPYGYYTEESNHTLLTKSDYKRIYTSKQMYSYSKYGGVVMGRNPIDSSESDQIFVNESKGYFNCYSLIRHFNNR